MKILTMILGLALSFSAYARDINITNDDIRVITPVVEMGNKLIVEVDLPHRYATDNQVGNVGIRFNAPQYGDFYGYADSISGNTLRFELETNQFMRDGSYRMYAITGVRTGGNDLGSASVSGKSFQLTLNKGKVSIITPEVRQGGTLIVEATIDHRNFMLGQPQVGNAELRMDYPNQRSRDLYGYADLVDGNKIRWEIEIPASSPKGSYTLTSIGQLRTFDGLELMNFNLRPMELTFQVK